MFSATVKNFINFVETTMNWFREIQLGTLACRSMKGDVAKVKGSISAPGMLGIVGVKAASVRGHYIFDVKGCGLIDSFSKEMVKRPVTLSIRPSKNSLGDQRQGLTAGRWRFRPG